MRRYLCVHIHENKKEFKLKENRIVGKLSISKGNRNFTWIHKLKNISPLKELLEEDLSCSLYSSKVEISCNVTTLLVFTCNFYKDTSGKIYSCFYSMIIFLTAL